MSLSSNCSYISWPSSGSTGFTGDLAGSPAMNYLINLRTIRHDDTSKPQRYQNFRFNQQLNQSVRGLVHEIVSTPGIMDLPSRLAAQLAGKEGQARQKAARWWWT